MGETPTAELSIRNAVAIVAVGVCIAFGLAVASSRPESPPSFAPHADVWHGSGTVRGTVRDESGHPVAGAEVRALLLDDAAQRASLQELLHGSTRRAKSGADGTYAFTDLPDMKTFVVVTKDGFDFEPSDRRTQVHARPGSVVDFVAHPMVDVPFSVLLPNGTPAVTSTIEFSDGNDWIDARWSDDRSAAFVRAGRRDVRATCGTGLVSDAFSAEFRAPRRPETIVLRLHGRPGIAGHVRFPKELARPDRIGVFARLADAPPGGHEGFTQYDASKDDGFQFALLDLAPGRYRLSTGSAKPFYVPNALRFVDVRDENVTADLDIPPPEPARTLTVRIVDPSGSPVQPDEATNDMMGTAWSVSGEINWWRRADGGFFVEFPPGERALKDRRLVITTAKFGRRNFDVPPLPTSPMEIRLDAPTTLEVVADGYPATPPSATLSVDLDDGRGPSLSFDVDRAAHGSLDATGRAHFGPLAPGAYDVTIRRGDYPNTFIAQRRVDLVSGENRVELSVGDSCRTLTVDAGAARKFWFATLRPAGERTTIATAQTDATGRVVFEWLRADIYDVEIDGETRRVDVAANSTLTW